MTLHKKVVLLFAILATFLMILYAQFILGHYSQCFRLEDSINSLGLSFGYSSTDVLTFIKSRSIGQLNCYLSFLRIWDSIFPLLYTLMHVFWMVYLFKKSTWLLLIPLLHMISDWVENFFEISLISQYMTTGVLNETLISNGSTITSLKWVLSIVTYIILLIGIIIKLRLFLKTRKQT